MYFILIAIIALFPQVSSIDAYSAIIPTVWVICFSLCFDYYDDLKRYLQDRRVNNQKVQVIRNGELLNTTSAKIKIGDILIVEEDTRAMADVILLSFVSS